MSRFKVLFKSTAVRLSALYILLFAICAATLVFYVTAMSERLLTGQIRDAVRQEVEQVQRAYDTGGMNLLLRTMERRARQPGANLYIIAGPSGDILAGNVASVQPGVFEEIGWTSAPFGYQRYTDGGGVERRHKAIANIFVLDNGLRILIGRDLGDPERFRLLVRQALMVALAIMGLGAIIIWFAIGRNALKRIDRMSDASKKIMAGDLSQRLPVGGSGDEFDRLSMSLNTMLERIEKLNEGLRQVSTDIAHDLRTPLSRLRQHLDAMRQVTRPVELEGAIDDALAQVDDVLSTFHALLRIGQIEGGVGRARFERVDLSAVMERVRLAYETAAEDAGKTLAAEIAPDVVVNGDPQLLTQLFANLIENSLRHAGKATHISMKLVQDGEAASAVVSDDGSGVPATERDRVLGRFYRLDASRSTPGSGLGLALVAAIAELHNATLTLSDNHPGLAVEVRIPRASH